MAVCRANEVGAMVAAALTVEVGTTVDVSVVAALAVLVDEVGEIIVVVLATLVETELAGRRAVALVEKAAVAPTASDADAELVAVGTSNTGPTPPGRRVKALR
jgi:hypothetical protein